MSVIKQMLLELILGMADFTVDDVAECMHVNMKSTAELVGHGEGPSPCVRVMREYCFSFYAIALSST